MLGINHTNSRSWIRFISIIFHCSCLPPCSLSAAFIKVPLILRGAGSVSLPPFPCPGAVSDSQGTGNGCYKAEHLIRGPPMASLTDFLAHLPASSGGCFSGPVIRTEPSDSPWEWKRVCQCGTPRHLLLTQGHPAGAQTLLPGSQPAPPSTS